MKRFATIVAALTVIVLGAQAPAVGSVPQGDQSVLDRLLAPADVPRALGAPSAEPTDSDQRPVARAAIDLCQRQAGGQVEDLGIPRSSGFEAMVVTDKPGDSLYREVDEVVAVYGSRAAATRAWRDLRAKARLCSGQVVVTNAADPPDGSTITDRYASGVSDGGNAVWLSTHSRWSTSDPISNAAVTTVYTVYRQSADAVIATWYYVNGRARTTLAEQRATRELAAELAARW
jgi:hypothetical protein